MGLEQIPVTVVVPDSGLSGNAWPLMMEISELVGHFVETGESAAIDLSALPLTEADKAWLRERLGTGQVHITLDAEGLSSLDETACPGVWWVTHRDLQGRVMAEFIEVTRMPEVAMAHPQDIKIGQAYLEGIVSELR